jgi:BirA family biotin operon repressor/biotin-[acetyl-CoA-carboxylase] ligase
MPAPRSPQLVDIVHSLGDSARRFDIDILECCTSTNAELLARAEAGAASGTVLVANTQSAGRGRRGRVWVSAPGDSLTFSLLWRFAPGTSPAGLSLAVGNAVARALEKVGADDTAKTNVRGHTALQLKWPNDILKQGKKLGGILIELVPGQPHAAVIGIGINLQLPPMLPEDIRRTAAALDVDLMPAPLLATLLLALLNDLERFAGGGFSSLRAEWLARHAFQNSSVRLESDFEPPMEGICRGVDNHGALLLEIEGRTERILSGEISLRAL